MRPQYYTTSINDKFLFETLAQYIGFKIQYYKNNFSGTEISKNFSTLLYGMNDITVAHHDVASRHTTLPPIISYRNGLYMTLPSMEVSSTFFIELFQPFLWMGILAIYSIFLLFLSLYIYKHKLKNNQYFESAFHIIGVSSEHIRFATFSLTSCIIIFTFLFYILGEYFTAFLTTRLVTKVQYPFESLEEMSLQSTYKICTSSKTRVRQILSDYKIYNHIMDGSECKILQQHRLAQNGLGILEALCNDPYLTLLMADNIFDRIMRLNIG